MSAIRDRFQAIHKRCVEFFLVKRGVQVLQSRLHALRLIRAHADPQQVHALRECGRVSQSSVVRGLDVELVFPSGKDCLPH